MSQITKCLILVASLILSNQVYAGPLQGTAFIVAPDGTELVPGGQSITGNIDVGTGVMNVEPWGPFLGSLVSTTDIEILSPGSYTRPAGNVTILDGQVGAHMIIKWAASDIALYMVWQVTNDRTTFTIVDSDGDGLPGHAMNNGPFPGFTGYYEFETTPSGPPQPGVNLVLNVDGGNVQECTGNLSDEVTVNAMPALFGGAELESISWTVDGEDAGTGFSILESLALGAHLVEATALTTTGQSDTESVSIQVRDTIRPVVKVAFLDNRGNEVESAGPGRVEISIKATDSCDPDPEITSSTARKTTLVSDGDALLVTGNLDNLQLPTTALNVTATAKDASGNFSFTTSESSKTLILE